MACLCLACARGIIITPPGGRHDATSRKFAVFTSLVSTSDWWITDPSKSMVNDAAVAICTARHYGSTMPFLLDFANLRDDQVAMLSRLGWKMHNVTDSIEMWQGRYKPVYNEAQAIQENRPWVDQPVQIRKDGWATYFKFKAWTYDEYDKILISDADIIWGASPDPILAGPGLDSDFHAFAEKSDRSTMGINTHLMIITPSKETYEKLVDRASSGNYVPYTNTEQDVLESHFRANENTGDVMGLFKHKHRNCICAGLDAGRLAEVQTCEDVWRACLQERGWNTSTIWREAEILEPLW
jgi:hypothetical protein